MSSPARDARLLAIANGFTVVKSRKRYSLTMKNPNTGKCVVQSQVGSVFHHGPLMDEVNTAWVSGVSPWNYQMIQADYNLFALANFNAGQIIKWLDPVSGESITFQPMALQWTNAQNQIQQISMPQSATAQVSDDVLYWPSAYGNGIGFKYIPSPTRLNKLLVIDSFSVLPSTSYDILELNFIMAFSSGVSVYIDSGNGFSIWDKKATLDTTNRIEFRSSGGSVLWSIVVPVAYSSGGSVSGTYRVKKQGSSFYISVRFTKSWLSSVPSESWPVVIDPSVDYQVGSSGDDGSWTDTSFGTTAIYGIILGRYNGYATHTFALFRDVVIPDDATIDSSKLTFRFAAYDGTPPACTLKFEAATPATAITGITDWNSRTKTTASISITGPTSGDSWDSDSINSIVEELMANSYAAGEAMMMMIDGGTGTGSHRSMNKTYDYSGNVSGPVITITYTEAVVSSWAGTWGG